MLILFLLLSVSLHQNLTTHPLFIVLACVSLAFSYISATSINDIADAKIDAINHSHSIGRPLITGEGNKMDLVAVFVIATLCSLLLAACINWWAFILVGISILINIAYSLPPTQFSYRTWLAPFVLGIAYVGIPYTLGLAIVDRRIEHADVAWFLGLYAMFVGRIILKDFRDRKGDAKYHKPTFLLRFGKEATCIFSCMGLVIGGGIILWQLRSNGWLILITALYLVSVLFMLRRLSVSHDGAQEQLSIGVGAKMGNGLLITLLAFFSLRQAGESMSTQLLIAGIVSLIFFINYGIFLRNPKAAIIGYKG
jgi:4-hydroxybenzoate polyprenyltransferase